MSRLAGLGWGAVGRCAALGFDVIPLDRGPGYLLWLAVADLARSGAATCGLALPAEIGVSQRGLIVEA